VTGALKNHSNRHPDHVDIIYYQYVSHVRFFAGQNAFDIGPTRPGIACSLDVRIDVYYESFSKAELN